MSDETKTIIGTKKDTHKVLSKIPCPICHERGLRVDDYGNINCPACGSSWTKEAFAKIVTTKFRQTDDED